MLEARDSSPIITDLPSSFLKPCRICKKNNLLAYGKRVNCHSCIQLKKAKQAERKAYRERIQRILQGSRNTSDAENEAPVPTTSSSPLPTSFLTTPSPPPEKRRPAVPLRDLEGKEREAAIRAMKAHVQGLVRNRGDLSDDEFEVDQDSSQGTEYQTANALYTALRTAVTLGTQRLNFNGFHIIIATDDIGQKKRLDLVANDLRKLVRLPFNRDEPIKKQRTPSNSMWNSTWDCNCMGFRNAVKEEEPAPSLSRSGSKGLLDWARVSKKRKTEEDVRVDCGGEIKITVTEDTHTHPLEITGQRIRVEITHK